MRLRGLIWIGVGLAIYFGSLALGRPLLLRFTNVPLGWVVAGIGVLYLAYDVWAQRRKARDEGGPGPGPGPGKT
jgi:hypothetical protein